MRQLYARAVKYVDLGIDPVTGRPIRCTQEAWDVFIAERATFWLVCKECGRYAMRVYLGRCVICSGRPDVDREVLR